MPDTTLETIADELNTAISTREASATESWSVSVEVADGTVTVATGPEAFYPVRTVVRESIADYEAVEIADEQEPHIAPFAAGRNGRVIVTRTGE